MTTRRALAIIALVAVCLAAALPLFAQEPAPWHLLDQAQGLDLRDASNRPVSRQALERDIRSGTQGVRRQAAGLSRLPGLRAWLEYMDQAALLLAGLRPARQEPPHRAALVQRPARAPKPRLLSRRLRPAPGPRAAPLSPWALSHPPAPGLSAPRVLRL